MERNGEFYLHIVPGAIVLLIGWLQFVRKIRLKNTRLHRAIGVIYSIGVVGSGVGGALIALNAVGGTVARAGFFSMSLLWLLTLLPAFHHLMKKRYPEHGFWMRLSYALTLAAVSLRLEGPLLYAFGFSTVTAYRIVAWSSWLGNILIWYLLEKNGVFRSGDKRTPSDATVSIAD